MTPPVRPISQWVEEEITLPPHGTHKNKPFRHSRHPVSRIWFDAIDSGRWWRYAVVAPTQCGKTLMCYVLPVLYHLFELNETVIIGLPDMRMANDKWVRDFLPVIESSRYSALLPKGGEGARRGKITSAIAFRHGATLRFMSSGGGDKARAGFPGCRVVAITETDGMDEPGIKSREGDPCQQIENRLRSYLERLRRTYMECTASIPQGKIWVEYTSGSKSCIVRPCPYCDEWVTPEREHLKGWQDAKDVFEAEAKSAWHCPKCEVAWTQEDREYGWRYARLVHDGQEITVDEELIGDDPRTHTLGFRWGAIDNPFTTAGACGAEEWRARESKDKENAEKDICQATNAQPYVGDMQNEISLEPHQVADRVVSYKRGIVPPKCVGIAIGIDTHRRDLYWEAKAVLIDGDVCTLHVIDHSRLDLDINKLSKEAIYLGLKELKKQFAVGWMDETGKKWYPTQVWIDSGYKPHQLPVYSFCKQANVGRKIMDCIWRPSKGYGEGQKQGITPYKTPDKQPSTRTRAQTNVVVYVGADYHISLIKSGKTDWSGVQLVHVNSDTWKTNFHGGLTIDAVETGAITLFETTDSDRDQYEAQVCGEVQREKFIKGKGPVLTWHYVSVNHYFDAGYLATGAADFVYHNHKRLSGKSKPRKRAEDYSTRPKAGDVSHYAGRAIAVR